MKKSYMNILKGKPTAINFPKFPNEQQRNDWFLGLYDPTSAQCDELLEEISLQDETNSNASLLSPQKFYREHEFSCDNLRCICDCDVCRSPQLRSRSEDKKPNKTEHILLYRCNSAEPAQETSTPHTTSSSCYSHSCSVSHSDHSVTSLHSPGQESPNNTCFSPVRKRKDASSRSRRCRRSTFSCACTTSCGHTSDIPPPMALIDVNRLSLQNLSVPISGTEHTRSPRIRCPGNCFNPHDTNQSLFDAPELHLRSNLSLNSSGTGSWTGIKTSNKEKSAQDDALESPAPNELLGVARLRTSVPRLADTSARDSGLSSHSSNSAYFSIWQSQNESAAFVSPRSQRLTDSRFEGAEELLPPPVPPHAPNSHAAAASLNNRRCGSTSDKLPSSGISSRTSVNESLLCGSYANNLTLRLTPFSLMKRELKHVDDAQSGFRFGHRSDSPIWKQNRPSNNSNDMVVTNCQQLNLEISNQPSVTANQPMEPDWKSPCPRCMNARRYFLDWARSSVLNYQDTLCTNYSKTTSVTAPNCKACRKHILSVGVNLFNREPLHGLLFLNRHRVVNINNTQDLAQFIFSSPGLARSSIGAFLGLPYCGPIVPIEVMRCLLERLDFLNLEIDQALRLVVHHFGIPVESQEIDRYLQCLASHYHAVRWSKNVSNKSRVSADQVLLLLYSILLLQTSLYNTNAVNSTMGRQTLSQFIRNSQSFMSPDSMDSNPNDSNLCTGNTSNSSFQVSSLAENPFPEPVLQEIYHRIRAEPLTPGPDHVQFVQRISERMTLSRNCGGPWNEDRQSFQLCDRLAEPHRRFVCFCTMVQFLRHPRSPSKIAQLRYVLLFNDMLILTKHERPECLSKSGHRLRASDQQRIRRGLLALLRNAPVGAFEKQHSNHLLNIYLRPPVALMCATHDLTGSVAGSCHLRATELSCIPRGMAGNRSTVKQKMHSPRGHQTGKLAVQQIISLSGCRLRLFQTQDCRFGLELWKPMFTTTAAHEFSLSQPDQHGNFDRNKLTLVATLAALTENDYENFLDDLIACLRESHTVFRELVSTRRKQ